MYKFSFLWTSSRSCWLLEVGLPKMISCWAQSFLCRQRRSGKKQESFPGSIFTFIFCSAPAVVKKRFPQEAGWPQSCSLERASGCDWWTEWGIPEWNPWKLEKWGIVYNSFLDDLSRYFTTTLPKTIGYQKEKWKWNAATTPLLKWTLLPSVLLVISTQIKIFIYK